MNTPDRVSTFDNPSVWLEFSPLAVKHNSVNLGQGFPDWSPPEFLQEIASSTAKDGLLARYARSAGHMNLVKTVANQYEARLNRKINPVSETLITVGASEALFLSIMSFVGKGDEVIIIEPAFDIYFGQLAMAEADVKSVPLISNSDTISCSSEFVLDWDLLEKTLSKETKAIILNTPHNPTGKVFTKSELERFAKLLEKYPECLVISDEVYEHLVFDGKEHISIASLPGMFERTLSIFSAGKTFATTGWKIGWIIGPEKLMKRLQICQQWVCFSVATPLQEAIALALEEARKPYKGFETYYEWFREDYDKKRNILFNGLSQAGYNPVKPEGSFFIVCDISSQEFQFDSKAYLKSTDLSVDPTTVDLNDYNFSRYLTQNKKVTAIPTSAFYLPEHKHIGEKWARFAFCKGEETLKQGINNLLMR